MDEQKPLSQYGIGPFYAATALILTLGVLALNYFGAIPILKFQCLVVPLKLTGVCCIISAAVLWINAVIVTRIAQHIRQNDLVTSGAYAWVRNPIYSAIMLLMWGLLLWGENLLILLLCPVYHLLMTVMVKHTEEKWLAERYGSSYYAYCKNVNRCIPWFPKRNGKS